MGASEDDDVSDNTRKQIQKQTRAQKKAAKEAAEKTAIDATRGPRAAKQIAIEKAQWFEAEHKRRPGSGNKVPANSNKTAPEEDIDTGKKRKRGSTSTKESKNKSRRANEHGKKKQDRTLSGSKAEDFYASNSEEEDHRPSKDPQAKKGSKTNSGRGHNYCELRSPPLESEGSSESYDESKDGSDDDDEDDDEDALGDMDDTELHDLIGSEVPQVIGDNLFDKEASCGRSASRTSESDGIVAKKHKKSSQKMSAKPTKRDEAFRNEHPDVIPQSSNEDRYLSKKAQLKKMRAAPLLSSVSQTRQHGSTVNKNTLEDDWPVHAQLRGNNLKEQHILIRLLVRDAIKLVQTTLVMRHAWPELESRLSEYRIEVLSNTARTLQKTDDRMANIRARIKKDDELAKVLGKLVIDRLANACGPVRTKGLDHIALFQLGVGEICVERVQALVANDMYIYPGKWSTDDNHRQFWVIKSKEIYLNEGLINVLKSAFFATSNSLGYKFIDLYKSSHPTRLEPELTPSLVALAATGLYAGLHAWQTGIKIDNEKFEGETFKSVYERHLEYLKSIKEQNVTAYHVLMSKLYSKVINTDTSTTNANKTQGSTLAVADLSEFI